MTTWADVAQLAIVMAGFVAIAWLGCRTTSTVAKGSDGRSDRSDWPVWRSEVTYSKGQKKPRRGKDT